MHIILLFLGDRF